MHKGKVFKNLLLKLIIEGYAESKIGKGRPMMQFLNCKLFKKLKLIIIKSYSISVLTEKLWKTGTNLSKDWRPEEKENTIFINFVCNIR